MNLQDIFGLSVVNNHKNIKTFCFVHLLIKRLITRFLYKNGEFWHRGSTFLHFLQNCASNILSTFLSETSVFWGIYMQTKSRDFLFQFKGTENKQIMECRFKCIYNDIGIQTNKRRIHGIKYISTHNKVTFQVSIQIQSLTLHDVENNWMITIQRLCIRMI